MPGTPSLNPAQLEAVRAVLPQFSLRDQLLFLASLHLGFRIRETLSMRVSDLFDENGAVRPFVRLERRRLKGGVGVKKRAVTSRTMPVHVTVAAAAIAAMEQRRTRGPVHRDAPLFPSRQGGRAVTRMQAWRIFRAIFDRAGLDGPGWATHVTRRTFARMIYERSKDVELTRAALAHASIATTQRYIRKSEEEVFALVASW